MVAFFLRIIGKKKKYRGTQEGFDIDANVEEVKRKTRLVLC